MIPDHSSVYIVKASYDEETRSLKTDYELYADKTVHKMQDMAAKIEGPNIENGIEPNRYRGICFILLIKSFSKINFL